ncbi:chromosome segregation ATPase [Photobacterium minamisatsumaniensis]|uniref:chromosome segregation ATPase n=1 Tax=Photobacterium minamisatsumaniensis TaxID=2910233 RepID=UPI003D142126
MTSWKVSLVAGLVVGSLLATAVWNRNPGPSQEDYDALKQKNAQLVEDKQVQQQRYEKLETQSAIDLQAIVLKLEQKQADLDAQKVEFEKQLSSMKKEQKTLTVTKKKLDTKVVELKTTAEKQKVVLDNSKELYQQQLRLQKDVESAKRQVTESESIAKEFKQACDEFKSGTSWNWVSQADCDKYEAKLDVVEEKQAQLVALESELEELNNRIEIDVPKVK